jgi:hypothetical protein
MSIRDWDWMNKDMEPEKDIFEQWKDERESRSWLRRKIDYISLWWEHDGRYMGKEFIRGIKSVWYWLPVIWKNRNWDHRFIFDIFEHKLKAQAEYIGKYGLHLTNWKDERDMMICVRLMEKIKTEYYSMEYMDYEKTKHWFEDIPDKPGYSSWESKQIEENFDDYFAKYPLIYKRVMNGEGWLKITDENDKHRIASNIAHINHQRARKLLFKILEQEIERWWD